MWRPLGEIQKWYRNVLRMAWRHIWVCVSAQSTFELYGTILATPSHSYSLSLCQVTIMDPPQYETPPYASGWFQGETEINMWLMKLVRVWHLVTVGRFSPRYNSMWQCGQALGHVKLSPLSCCPGSHHSCLVAYSQPGSSTEITSSLCCLLLKSLG